MKNLSEFDRECLEKAKRLKKMRQFRDQVFQAVDAGEVALKDIYDAIDRAANKIQYGIRERN